MTARNTVIHNSCSIAVVAPQDPPPYTAPSQLPPSYEDALKTSYPVPPGYSGTGIDGYIAGNYYTGNRATCVKCAFFLKRMLNVH